jgi:hypothetical protein
MTLVSISIADRRSGEDRRPEHEVRLPPDGVVVVAADLKPLEQLGQGRDPKAARQVIVQRGDRLPEQDSVMRPLRTCGRGSASGRLQVEPARWRVVKGNGEPPGRSGGSMSFANVGESQRPSSRSARRERERHGAADLQ